jgi:hypothetical protein
MAPPEEPGSTDPLEVVLKFVAGLGGIGLLAFFAAGRELSLHDSRLWWIVGVAAVLGGLASMRWGSRFWEWLFTGWIDR